uniref:Uncharacterized protein n=1 Tax=Rhizophora mucronata TaxID=61149 RepID=A0A2P2NGZ5_RHIMU
MCHWFVILADLYNSRTSSLNIRGLLF